MGIAIVAVMLGVVSPASAGPKDKAKADALFKQGKQLLAAKRYAEACKAFEDSQALDAAIGTQLNIALCFEQWGKLATAQAAYLEAEKQAAVKGDSRAAAARQRADALTARIPKIVFVLPDPVPADLVVEVDDREIGPDTLRLGVSVDPGMHRISYRFGSDKPTAITAEIVQSETKRITVEVPRARGKVMPPPEPPPEPVKTVSRGRTRRIIGLTISGGGVVIAGVGGALALIARSDYRTAFADHCSSVDNSCDDEGYEATRDARTKANIATGLVIGGGAVIVAGAIVFFTAPKGRVPVTERALYLTPIVRGDGGGLAIGGSL